MKKLMVSLILTVACAQPALAGHGFIEESDTCIYVEYTGDPGDKVAETATAPVVDRAANVKAALAAGIDLSKEESRRQAKERQVEVSTAARELREERRQVADARPERRSNRSWRRAQQTAPGVNPE